MQGNAITAAVIFLLEPIPLLANILETLRSTSLCHGWTTCMGVVFAPPLIHSTDRGSPLHLMFARCLLRLIPFRGTVRCHPLLVEEILLQLHCSHHNKSHTIFVNSYHATAIFNGVRCPPPPPSTGLSGYNHRDNGEECVCLLVCIYASCVLCVCVCVCVCCAFLC